MFEAVICPSAFTLNLLADIIKSVPVDEERTKLVLDNLLAPK